jgi:protein transport protein SEC24
MASFHGNFFVRSTDLLAMPAVPQDQSYAIEIQIEETITAPFVMFQVAVLHTTCYGQYGFLSHNCGLTNGLIYDVGERRIRVINLALPTTSNLSELYASADQVAIATLLANKAVERCITHSLENSREAVFSKLVEILTAYKGSMTAAGAGASAQLSISENLKMLPVLILGLLKNVSLIFCYY